MCVGGRPSFFFFFLFFFSFTSHFHLSSIAKHRHRHTQSHGILNWTGHPDPRTGHHTIHNTTTIIYIRIIVDSNILYICHCGIPFHPVSAVRLVSNHINKVLKTTHAINVANFRRHSILKTFFIRRET